MKKREEFLRDLGQIMSIFGITVAILVVLTVIVGEDAKGYSSIFALGGDGLSIETLMQFLLMAISVRGLCMLLFSDKMISRISVTVRTCLLFFLIILLVAVYAAIFGWFPLDDLAAWGYFLACFAACAFASAYIMAWKNDKENKELEEALKRLKESQEEEK